MIEEKVWGRVHHVVMSPDLMVSVLEVKAGTFCSIHRHAYRVNEFKVISGVIKVNLFGKNVEPQPSPTHCWTLVGGESMSVAEIEWHQFVVEEDGVVIEVYRQSFKGIDVMLDDIDRYSLGGVLNA